MKKIFLTTFFLIFIITACKKVTVITTDETIKQEPKQTEVIERLNEDDVGSQANDFSLQKLDGKKFVLSEQKGKPTLINIWATWCMPCVREMPAFERLKEEYKDKVNIVAVDIGEKKEVVEKFMKENNYTFDVALDTKGITQQLYDFQGIPFTFLIDEKGNLVNIFRGSRGEEAQYNLYKNAIEKILG